MNINDYEAMLDGLEAMMKLLYGKDGEFYEYGKSVRWKDSDRKKNLHIQVCAKRYIQRLYPDAKVTVTYTSCDEAGFLIVATDLGKYIETEIYRVVPRALEEE